MLKYNSRLPRRVIYLERYRSGHNEAVLKTVCPQGRVGSNPTLSVEQQKSASGTFFVVQKLKGGIRTRKNSWTITSVEKDGGAGGAEEGLYLHGISDS